MTRHIVLAANPRAGTRTGRLVEPVRRALAADGAKVTLVAEPGPDRAADALRAAVAAGADAVVALGGDGTVHTALQAVAGTPVALGVVPTGGGNDLARELGLPLRDLRAAVRVARGSRVRVIDAARCGSRWFLSVLTTGVSARVAERVNAAPRRLGPARYLLGVAAELGGLRPEPVALELDGTAWEGPALLVAVGNAGAFGAGMRICPRASLDDGLLDVVVVGPVSRARFATVFPSVYRGAHLGLPEVASWRARRVSLAAGGAAAHADGERLSPAPLTCEAVPGAVRFLVGP
ncbi:diacylglycerol/lipid kinase family protein [Allonocardiopsis opalescens]|uniref:Diacylglycerol kinase (ATP) n=1 Tax=Allonocardiopsis opalescens TaxID=1144618 RepID=A0A2T0PU68_9ACTN|nr:diacylglycerol kinase family protein [Allonocardiopsis opalescens]PRX92338.1 diacylglycerol kinase (ATP) [Allonocardiopsis opalescens]